MEKAVLVFGINHRKNDILGYLLKLQIKIWLKDFILCLEELFTL